MTVSKTNLFDLPEERLASTTETGGRVKLYPADVSGVFRTWRTRVYLILVVVFLGLPWVSVGGHPLVFLDVVHRQFWLFGISFQADEVPMVFLVLALVGVGIAFVTAWRGRVWCGWACPQTVFIDVIYRRIERWIEGNAHSQKRLDKAPWTFQKSLKKGLKTFLFLGVSWLIAHSFLAYFVGADQVAQMITRSPVSHPVAAALTLLLTLVIWIDFGVFREQFCIIACPYGRLQSVLMDTQSRGVAYDPNRGEPRDREAKNGACIECHRCVQVCPTGVDIRRGTQLECIHCTACIDACDRVMDKIVGNSNPRQTTEKTAKKGLIRYISQAELQGKLLSHTRLWIYGSVFVLLLGVLTGLLIGREPFRVTVVRGRQSFTVLENGDVVNVFTAHVYNRQATEVAVTFQSEVPHVVLVSSQRYLVPGHGRVSVPLVIKGVGTSLRYPKTFVLQTHIKAVQDLLAPPFIDKTTVSLVGPL